MLSGQDSSDWYNRRRWYENEDQYVRRQRAESDAVASAADARLRRSLNQVAQEKNALARSLANLSAAFDAFVELTETRAELTRFVAPEAVRGQVRVLLGNLLRGTDEGSDSGSVRIEDVPGYWLCGAATGLSALMRGDEAEATSAIAAASDCDERRTAVFLVLSLAVVGAGEKAGPWTLTALGPAGSDDEVSTETHMIWRLAAEGDLGPAGKQALLTWLGAAHYPVEQLRTWLDTRANRPARLIGAKAASPEAARRAVDTLDQLSQLYFADTPPDDAIPPQQDEVPPTAVLDGLIDEGAPVERELIRRVAELAAEVHRYRSAGESPAAAPRQDTSAGKLHELLEADFRTPATSRRTVAHQALARTAADLADLLLEESTPTASTVYRTDIEQQRLAIDTTQPIDPQLAEVFAEIDRRAAPVPGVPKRYNATLAERAVERKAAARQRVQAGITLLTEQNAELPAIRESAEQIRETLLARLGQLAEHRDA